MDQVNTSFFCYEPPLKLTKPQKRGRKATKKKLKQLAKERRLVAEALGEDTRIDYSILYPCDEG